MNHGPQDPRPLWWLIATAAIFVALMLATAVATHAQDGDSTTVRAIPATVTATYGESPIASGLTLDASWDNGLSVSLNADNGYLLWLFPVWESGMWSLVAGPSAGIQSQVPFLGPFAALTTPSSTTLTLWPGVAAGSTEEGFSLDPSSAEVMWFYADITQSLPADLSLTLAALQFEGGNWNVLPGVLWTPEFIDGGRLRFTLTLDENRGWKPLFAIGARVNLR